MAGAMAWRRNQGDFIANPRIAGDELSLPGIDDRRHGIAKNRRFFLVSVAVAPIDIFALAEQIARLFEGRDPSSGNKARVPADVIDVQMRAKHGVDALRRKTGRRHHLQERSEEHTSEL